MAIPLTRDFFDRLDAACRRSELHRRGQHHAELYAQAHDGYRTGLSRQRVAGAWLEGWNGVTKSFTGSGTQAVHLRQAYEAGAAARRGA